MTDTGTVEYLLKKCLEWERVNIGGYDKSDDYFIHTSEGALQAIYEIVKERFGMEIDNIDNGLCARNSVCSISVRGDKDEH